MDVNEKVKITIAELKEIHRCNTKADMEFLAGVGRMIEAWYEDGIAEETIDEYIDILKGTNE